MKVWLLIQLVMDPYEKHGHADREVIGVYSSLQTAADAVPVREWYCRVPSEPTDWHGSDAEGRSFHIEEAELDGVPAVCE